jgi:hypothetical protein
MTDELITYTCENCGHASTECNDIDIAEWASYQDPNNTIGLPVGTCTECNAPVYLPDTFDKIEAASVMLAALKRIAFARDYCAEHGDYPRNMLGEDQQFDDWAADIATTVIAAAEAAGITAKTEG